ncbi:uncharacterized protein BKA55DRAFT_683919 [Fusarium redolens]|uniref:Uncharacterized protein n=1 Tax=Fusarium redolens TaxID=48865 RepID=A0A9P9RA14_FUSRE|nr:uncharacterized protein BKA55DRAFT_683919 [Fusarium redolens]KAH7270863.1 hypothetical protein BKA55DRAFT_683919 [Fusarium redolens]
MSNQDLEEVLPSPSVEMIPPRPQQQGRLALLPTEILLKITGEPGKDGGTIPYRDLKGLAVSCSRLFHLIRPMYYFADGYAVFHSAVAHGDLKAIQRCFQLGAAPHTKSEPPSFCTCPSELPHKKHRPFGSPLEHDATGSFPVGKCLDGLQWLLDEGLEANEQMDHPLLQSYGYCVPYQVNTDAHRLFHQDERDVKRLIYTPFDVALRLYCPANFLGVALEGYKRRGLAIKRTNVGNVAWNLFLGLMDPSIIWKESFLGEATHGFQKKIQLLVDYEVVDSDELLALQCILEAMKDITSKAQRLGGLDEDRDGKECWHRLCEAVSLSARHLDRSRDNARSRYAHYPLHSFTLEGQWNPWSLWFNYELQKPKFRAEMSFSWMQHDWWKLEQDENGMWYDSQWNFFHRYEFSSRTLPKWQRVNFDEYVAAVEKQWLKLNPYYSTSTSQDSNDKA